MALWKVEIYENDTDSTRSRWGVMVAATELEAQQIIQQNSGDAGLVETYTIRIAEIPSLPAGTFFWKAN